MSFENEIQQELKNHKVDFIHYVDISKLSSEQNRNLPNAIIFGVALTPLYIQEVINDPDYVKKRVENNYDFADDEFFIKETKTGKISDKLAEFLISKGSSAYSQSDENQVKTTKFDGVYGRTLLPHKTIALMAGLGFIGKNNMLLTKESGNAQCLGTVLTNAPLKTALCEPQKSLCGNCNICIDICEFDALKGHTWNINSKREDIIDVYKCTTCLKCLVFCPWTKNYRNKNLKKPDK